MLGFKGVKLMETEWHFHKSNKTVSVWFHWTLLGSWIRKILWECIFPRVELCVCGWTIVGQPHLLFRFKTVSKDEFLGASV